MRLIIIFFGLISFSNPFAGQDVYNPGSPFYDSLYTYEELAKMDFPEICPEVTFEDELYNPTFLLESDYYVNRYKEPDLMYKVIDNFGNGFDSLYGTRNMRTILHGVAYRGGANNYYHKTNKRKNNNPLPDDGIANLCQEGFSHSIYLYKNNWDTAPEYETCDCVNQTQNDMEYSQYDYYDKAHIKEMLELIYVSATDPNTGPVYLHCWNGWHASGFISAVILKQFCGFSDLDATSYWDLGTDGANTSPRYNSIRKKIMDFEPYPEFKLEDSLGNKLCAPMPAFIDSSKLHISIEHLVVVPEAIPLNTILILTHVKFGPGKATFPSASTNEDLINLVAAMQKSPELKIQISGHTDRSGDEQTNKTLSKTRAKFVYDHLIGKGISADRISHVGYGSIKPAYSNRTKDGRAANRRIEVKVVSKKAESMTNLVDETTTLEEDSFQMHNKSSLIDFEQKEIGESLILKHILFEPNMTELTITSIPQADTLADILKVHPELYIEVFGYTDKSGIEEKNIVLSKKRAKALHDYLIEKGIDSDRLYYSGCGSENPIAPNKYRWGRDINRRIEVVIIKK
tara:strand:+ start:252 stop:1964 length:1713 start_codon:yes stop_codon:yes gene_type:complete